MAHNEYFSKSEAQAYCSLLNRVYGTSYVSWVNEGPRLGYTIRVNLKHVDSTTYTLSTYQDIIDMIQMDERMYNLPGKVVKQAL